MSEEVSGVVRKVQKVRQAYLNKVLEQTDCFDNLDEICFIDQDHIEECGEDLFNIISSIKIREPNIEPLTQSGVTNVKRRKK